MSVSKPDLQKDADVVALKPEANKIVAFAKSLAIQTDAGYQQAADYLKTIKGLLKDTEAVRQRYIKPVLELQRTINADAKAIAEPLEDAERRIKRAMIAYSNEQDRIRREEQRKAEEEARKQREKLEAQAAKALASGKVEKAEQLEQRAATVVAPVVQREAPKVTGISTRENWYAECSDLKALVKAVAEGRAPLSFVMANDKVLGQQARSLKSDFVCDGVRVWSEKNLGAGVA